MANEMRDRLVELLQEAHYKWTYSMDNFENVCADHLIESGVIVPPCKVGQTVWFIRNKELIETCVEKIILKHGGLYIKLCCNSMYETACNSIGKTVFLTKEEAKQKLNEMRGE